jgi:hypothetical protein
MAAVVYTPLLGRLNERLFPITQDGFNSIIATYGTVIISSATLAAYALLAGNQTLSGTNTVSGDFFFKNLPWADVRAYGAKGDGVTNDQPAIQAAIDFVYATYGGGVVFVPPGTYNVGTTLTVKGGVTMQGASRQDSQIRGDAQDATVLLFDASCLYASARDLLIAGYNSSLATTPAVQIVSQNSVTLRDCYCLDGSWGLVTNGVDGVVDNCFIAGYTGCVQSTGANWYTRVKLDTFQGSPTYGFQQNKAPGGALSAENHFVLCDLSGGFTWAVQVNDGTVSPRAFTKFSNSVLSAPVNVVSHTWTAFVECHMGTQPWSLTATNPVTIVGCYAVGGTLSLPGANVIKSANFQIV